MKILTTATATATATALALMLGMSGAASATAFTFTDSPATSTMVTEDASFFGSVNYSGLDGSISSAFLTILLSDDSSSTLGTSYVDVPIEKARLSLVTGDLGSASPSLIAEVDGNSGSVFGVTVDLTGAPFSATPAPGTVDSYFDYDVTALLGGTSGTLSFTLDALDTRANFPFLGGGGPYFEDFNYEGAELTIETSPVPVPAAIWLMGSGLLGLLGISGKKSRTV